MKEIISISVHTALIQNPYGEILMVKRDEPSLPEVHGTWELPGGKCNEGESIEEALPREIMEETGYRVKMGETLGDPIIKVWEYPEFTQNTFVFCYFAHLIEDSQAETHDHHVSDIRWVNRENIDEYPLLPGVLYFIEQLK